MTTANKVQAPAQSNGETPDKKTVVRRTFTERLTDLTFEEKVQVVKDLKEQISEELYNRELAAKEAAELAKDI